MSSKSLEERFDKYYLENEIEINVNYSGEWIVFDGNKIIDYSKNVIFGAEELRKKYSDKAKYLIMHILHFEDNIIDLNENEVLP